MKQEKFSATVLMDDLSGSKRGIKAHHGLSILIEIIRDGNKMRILLDTGDNGDDLINNFEVMGVSPDDIDLCILSHKHYDHTGGLKKLLSARKSKLNIFAHPDIFLPSFSNNPWHYAGIPYSKEELELIGANFILVKDFVEIGKDIYISGEISQRNGEYEMLHGYTAIRDGKKQEERHIEEIGLYICDEESVHIFSGCSHSGILNIIDDAVRKTGNKKLGIVMGGFHFLSSTTEKIGKQIDEIYMREPKAVIAGHCTGFNGLSLLYSKFGKRFSRYSTGDIYHFTVD